MFCVSLFSIITTDGLCQQDSVRLSLSTVDELWWAGIINHGNLMPITIGYNANLFANLYGNQAQPLLLSNKGDVVWSAEAFKIQCKSNAILLTKESGDFISYHAGNSLKEAYLYASKTYFPPAGKKPDNSNC